MGAVAATAELPASGSHCIGCPGGGGSGVSATLIGIVVVLVGALVISQRRNRRERNRQPDPRAASLKVTCGRAIGTLALLIGLLIVILQP